MKKILLIVLLVVFIPITKAYEYGIENYFINATLQDNGDLVVEEYFNMNGESNGFNRIINHKNSRAATFDPNSSKYGGSTLHNGSAIKIVKIAAVDVNPYFDFNLDGEKEFKKVNSAYKGDYGVYTESKTNDGESLFIYLPSKKNKAYYIKYIIKDIAISHNDIGEVGWNIFGNELTESVEHLVVTFNVPNNSGLIKVFGHGPLNGYTKIESSEQVKLVIDHLSAEVAIDIRVLFDKSIIPNCYKYSNVNALDKIIAYETELANAANKEREQFQKDVERALLDRFKELEEEPSRYHYNATENQIGYLSDEEKKTYYQNMLVDYQPKVDAYEYNEFSKIVNKVGYVKYSDYKKASSICNNVFGLEIQEKMQKELTIFRDKIKSREIKIQINLAMGILCLIAFSYGYKVLLKKLALTKKYYNQINYLRELPSKLSPSAAGLLIDKRLSKDEVAATLLNLIKKKVISFNKKEDGSYDLIYNPGSKVSYINSKKEDNLTMSGSEKLFVEMLFNKKTEINTKKIPKIKPSDYESWRDSILNELETKSLIKTYFDKPVDIRQFIFGGLIIFIGLAFFRNHLYCFIGCALGFSLIISFLYKLYQERFILWFNYPILICFIVYELAYIHLFHYVTIMAVIGMIITHKILHMIPNKILIKLTKEGKQEYVKWNAFKSFLMDFSRIDLRDVEEIVLWEDYLIYGTALGISKKVIDKMRVKIENINIDNEMFFDYVLFSSLSDIDSIASSFDDISNDVIKAGAPSITFPESSGGSWSDGGSWSSGSGDGGGFSSDGGGFGGGGGGGRF